MKYILILVIVFMLWICRGRFSNRNVKKPVATDSTMMGNIEKRTTTKQLIASVSVTGANNSEALNKGFTILADFIFGNNTDAGKIAMTAPVISKKQGKPIAMTAPVTSTKVGDMYTVSFFMPSEYTLETLPKPNNNRITISEQPQVTRYVHKFGGWANESSVKQEALHFVQELKDQNIDISGEYTLSQYNDPWTPRFMRKNELWIDAQ